jgi:hypothetical protein
MAGQIHVPGPDEPHLLVCHCVEERGDGLAIGKPGFRPGLQERLENEPPLVELRMRECEVTMTVDFDPFIEEQVEIQRSRPPVLLTDPPGVVLNRL